MASTALTMAQNLVAGFEGFRSQPYQDQAGRWTIGFGFTTDPRTGLPVSKATPGMTESDARTALNQLVETLEITVQNFVTQDATPGQLAAMTSLAYNIGASAFAASTLLHRFNSGDISTAADEFLKWDHAGGVVNQGLLNRRKMERTIFQS